MATLYYLQDARASLCVFTTPRLERVCGPAGRQLDLQAHGIQPRLCRLLRRGGSSRIGACRCRCVLSRCRYLFVIRLAGCNQEMTRDEEGVGRLVVGRLVVGRLDWPSGPQTRRPLQYQHGRPVHGGRVVSEWPGSMPRTPPRGPAQQGRLDLEGDTVGISSAAINGNGRLAVTMGGSWRRQPCRHSLRQAGAYRRHCATAARGRVQRLGHAHGRRGARTLALGGRVVGDGWARVVREWDGRAVLSRMVRSARVVCAAGPHGDVAAGRWRHETRPAGRAVSCSRSRGAVARRPVTTQPGCGDP